MYYACLIGRQLFTLRKVSNDSSNANFVKESMGVLKTTSPQYVYTSEDLTLSRII